MKQLYTFLAVLLMTASTFAQAPGKMSYQAVVRDSGDALVTNQAVGMQISILQTTATGTAVYVETQTPTTNVNGLVTLEIGTGTVVSGDFTTIDWSADSYFIKTETDPTGGASYTITGTSQLLSVPYALYAAKSGDSAALQAQITALQTQLLPSVTNCGQIWQSTNLDVTTYRDGTPIPQVTDPTAWAGLTTGAWCYYNNDANNGNTYGKLYNWYAVAGIYDAASLTYTSLRKQLAPNGWHIPTDAEWTVLTDCLGGETVAGGAMKETGTLFLGTGLWARPNTGATNSSGFTGLPGGYCVNNGTFNNLFRSGSWWSSTELDTTFAWYRSLDYANGSVGRGDFNKAGGFSVRCLRD